MKRAASWCAWWLASAPFWIFPAAVASTVAAFTQPVPTWQTARAAVVLAAVGAAVFALLGRIVPDGRRRGLALSICALLFVASPVLAARLGLGQFPWAPLSVWLALCLVALVALVRAPVERVSPWIAPLNLMAIALAVVEAGLVYQSRPQPLDPRLQEVIRRIQDVRIDVASSSRRPDIYDILLDSFGRPDVLRRRFAVDVGPIAEQLQKRGFDVIDDAGSNYDATYLSVPSMLNMNYLDALAPAMGNSGSFAPLHELISTNVVMRTLKSAGYHTVLLGGGYSATQDITAADVCRCSPLTFGEFEAAAVSYTPFSRIGFGGFELGPHRRRILETLDALDRFAVAEPQPVFVFAHILSPHPPLVFGEGGEPTSPPGGFNFGGGVHYAGTTQDFARRYEAQARYIARRALAAADHLLAMSAARGREAVVIVHGDHNTRFEGNEFAPKSTDGDDVLPILLAIRWVPGTPGVTPVRVQSLVNLYREVFRRYLGATLPVLPDRGFVAPFATPYRFIPVTPAERGGAIPR